MLPMTREWVDKAETDYVMIAAALRIARTATVWEPICFHAQQCVEKYLKARLVEGGIVFPKTHNLLLVVTLAVPVEPSWGPIAASVQFLNGWAVAIRYPGPVATQGDAVRSILLCRQWRARVRRSLGL